MYFKMYFGTSKKNTYFGTYTVIQTHSLVKYTAVPKHTWGERQDIKEHNYATHTGRDCPVGAKDNDNRGGHSQNIESHELDDAYC